MSIMGIGFLTLSATNDQSQAKESLSKSNVQEATLKAEESAITSVSPTVTVAPTPTPLPVFDIDEDSYPDIKKLFKKFYKAKNDRDVKTIKAMLSDPTKVDSKDELKKKTEYIEEYAKIKTYTKKGFEDGTYIVYVYHEIKFTGIKTPAPGLSKFYLITGEDGKLKIFSGEMEGTIKDYYNARNEDADVVALIEMTNKASNKAMKDDKDLKSFWKNIDKLASKTESKAEGDSAE